MGKSVIQLTSFLLVFLFSSTQVQSTVVQYDEVDDLFEDYHVEDDGRNIWMDLSTPELNEIQRPKASKKDGDSDTEVILGSGPMISPDVIIDKFSSSKLAVEDLMKNKTGDSSELEERGDEGSVLENEVEDDEFDPIAEFREASAGADFLSKFRLVKKTKEGKTCKTTINGISGAFEMNFEDDCTILIETPTNKTRLILQCEQMQLPKCSVNKEAITINLNGDLSFGRNSYYYCGNSRIRTTGIGRQIAIRIKETPDVKGSVKCMFTEREHRFINFRRKKPGDGFESLCGRLGRTSKIVGGRQVPAGLFPWAAQLDITRTDGTQTACTGSLISERFVLTAAHCLKRAEYVSVYMGGSDRLKFTGQELTIQAEKYILHRRWDPKSLTADIALVKLSEPVQFTEEVSPICLQEPESLLGFGLIRRETWAGKNGVAVGWGRLTTKKTAPRQLYRVRLPFLTNRKCSAAYSFFFQKQSMICTDSKETAAICYGDSGGPLMYKRNEIVHQVGVASFSLSRKCGESPDVFTKVSEYARWIKIRVKTDST